MIRQQKEIFSAEGDMVTVSAEIIALLHSLNTVFKNHPIIKEYVACDDMSVEIVIEFLNNLIEGMEEVSKNAKKK